MKLNSRRRRSRAKEGELFILIHCAKLEVPNTILVQSRHLDTRRQIRLELISIPTNSKIRKIKCFPRIMRLAIWLSYRYRWLLTSPPWNESKSITPDTTHNIKFGFYSAHPSVRCVVCSCWWCWRCVYTLHNENWYISFRHEIIDDGVEGVLNSSRRLSCRSQFSAPSASIGGFCFTK